MRTKRILIALSCAVILTAFTGYVLLDTFVIPRTYAAEVTQESSETSKLFETYANTGSDDNETDPETETEYSSEQSDSNDSTKETETD